MNDKPWRIHEICKTCKYRETVGYDATISTDWANTCCCYFLIWNETIDHKYLTDDFCPGYKKASKRGRKKYESAVQREQTNQEKEQDS